MTAPTLRPYQADAVDLIRDAYRAGARRVLFQLPTGGGKTVVFSHVLAGAVQRGRRVLVLTHRAEILAQIEAAVTMAEVAYGRIAAGVAESDASVQLASIDTLARPKRLDRWRDRFDLVVVDECQHAVSPTWARVLGSQPRAMILGVSATPQRLDGRGLIEQFDQMVIGPQAADLIKAGWLSPFVVYQPTEAPDMTAARIRAGDFAIEDQREAMDGVVIGAAVDEYRRICPGVPAVVFCVDIQHSQEVAERFRAAGVRATHVDGETPASERRRAVAGLADGSLDVITNCNLFGEGVDIPVLGAAILLRPTASLALFLQQVGRTLRPSPDKSRALILDFAGNTARHGLPDAPRQWSLDSKPVKQRERSEGAGLRRCKACCALNRASAHECSECGADLRTPKERREIEIALEQANRREEENKIARWPYRKQVEWAAGDERRLRTIARVKGYKPGWVYFQIKEFAETGARSS